MLQDGGINEGAHQKEVYVVLCFDSIVALQHHCFKMRCHQPRVLTWVELVRVAEGHVALYLVKSLLGPLHHEHAQVHVVVHGVIVELFLFYAVGLILEIKVEPLEDV